MKLLHDYCVRFFKALPICFAVLYPALSQAGEPMPLPSGAQFIQYCPVSSPITSSDPSAIRPLGVGNVATGGNIKNLVADIGEFENPVDIYLGLYAPAASPEVFLLRPDNTLQPLSSGLVPYETDVWRLKKQFFGGDIDISSLSLRYGNYDFYLMAVPAGNYSYDKYYLWNTSLVIGPSNLSITPQCIDFGAAVIGDIPNKRTITISNPGYSNSGSLKINAIAPLNDARFPVSDNTCTGAALSPGQNCTFNISFNPDTEGQKNLDVAITTGQSGTANQKAGADPSDSAGDFKVRLMGSGILRQCSYSISSTTAAFTSSGGTGRIRVRTDSGCSWTVALEDVAENWITVTSGSSGEGNGDVNFTVAANSSGSSRKGTITVAGQDIAITQEACTYSISWTDDASGSEGWGYLLVTSNGGRASVNIGTQSGCKWTASEDLSWVDITSGGSGEGNGDVNFTVTANSGLSSRTGTMTLAGHTFTLKQSVSGSSTGCAYSISPESGSFGCSGGNITVTVSATCGCSWAADVPVEYASWLSIPSESVGCSNGTVTVSASSSSSAIQRSGEVNIADKRFAATQSCSPTCEFSPCP